MERAKDSKVSNEIDFTEVGFLTEINEKQMDTIAAVYDYSAILKKKIYFALDNYGITGSVSVEEVFNEFLDIFVKKPQYAFNEEYSDDPDYYVYPYIVSRLEYFLKDTIKGYFGKINNEIRIYEDKMDSTDKVPRNHISQELIPGCPRSKQEFDEILNDFYVEEAFQGLKELSEYYGLNILDYLLLEAKSTMIDKALTTYEMDNIMKTNKSSELRKNLGIKASKISLSEEEIVLKIKEIDESACSNRKKTLDKNKLYKMLYEKDCAQDAKRYLKTILHYCSKNKIDMF